ncbi:MAG: aromatic ring-hydroxylating oxygenase subunit alpha [Anderseniella sp.]
MKTSLDQAILADIRDLAKTRQAGFALPREFYTSPAVFEHDIKAFWNRNWIWVGHVSQLPEPGSFFRFDYGTESIIVVRDRKGDIHAHINVCRHRGSRVCLEAAGKTSVLSCPYHAWTYDLDGSLRTDREMDDQFNRADYSLFSANLKIFQGLILVCLSEDPPDLEPALSRLAPLTKPFGIGNLKIAHAASYPVPANWKLALENYLECYHCAPAHKEYSRSHSLKDPGSMTEELLSALDENSRKAGLPTEVLNETGPDAAHPGSDIYYRRYPLYPGYKTGSRTGDPLAPLLGSLSGYDGGATDIMIGPLNSFLAYADHIVGYRFVPGTLQETDIQIVWMVRDDAVEGSDYTLADLTWLWDVTSQDDERIIRYNQQGVNSVAFRPGPLSSMEWGIETFYHGYLQQVLG